MLPRTPRQVHEVRPVTWTQAGGTSEEPEEDWEGLGEKSRIMVREIDLGPGTGPVQREGHPEEPGL
ncbi:MAG: hypothetical protein MZV70_54460 [Desulfobacterales bacterium]|nr:hypothetical protein [Desulfobacterales bacterium]